MKKNRFSIILLLFINFIKIKAMKENEKHKEIIKISNLINVPSVFCGIVGSTLVYCGGKKLEKLTIIEKLDTGETIST